MNSWIKCSEKLPPDDCTKVLGYFPDSGDHIQNCHLNRHQVWNPSEPTHWMPMIQSPEGY